VYKQRCSNFSPCQRGERGQINPLPCPALPCPGDGQNGTRGDKMFLDASGFFSRKWSSEACDTKEANKYFLIDAHANCHLECHCRASKRR